MLKGLSSLLTPELLKVLCEMGHGDEIVLADANFPAASLNSRVIRLDAHAGTDVLQAIMSVFPLDTYADGNAILMEVVPGDSVETSIWEAYEGIMEASEPGCLRMGHIERFAFYDRAARAYAVVATGESVLYANLILKKGIVLG